MTRIDSISLIGLYFLMFFFACSKDTNLNEEMGTPSFFESFLLTKAESVSLAVQQKGTYKVSQSEAIERFNRFAVSADKDVFIRVQSTTLKKSPTTGKDLYYEVIFESEKGTGFSLLSADERADNMLCYTEVGAISDTSFNKSLQFCLKLVDLYIEEKTKEEYDIEVLASLAKEKLATNAQKLFINKGIDPPPFDPNTWTYVETFYEEIEDSWLKTIPGGWHQQAPYNDSLPLMPGVPPANDGRAWVGCAMIAVTQIMSFHKKAFCDYIIPSDWNAMISDATTSAKLKRLMKDAFNDMKFDDPFGRPDANGTASDFNKSKDFFTNNGFTVGPEYNTYSFEKIFSALYNGPALLSASEAIINKGHQWVVDGVKTITWSWTELWTIWYINTLFEFKTPVSNGISKYVRYDWGWGSGYHSWFADGVFTVTHPSLGPLNICNAFVIIGVY